MVRNFVFVLLAAAVLAGQAGAAAPAAPKGAPARAVQIGLAGDWLAEQGTPGAAPVQAALTFTQTGRVVSGTMKAGDVDMFVVDVKQMGNAVSFSIVIPGTPYVTVPYTGTLIGGTLDMTGADPALGVYKLTAVRAAPPAAAPPVVAVAVPAPSPAEAPAPEPVIALNIPIPIARPEPPAPEVVAAPEATAAPDPVAVAEPAEAPEQVAAIPVPKERPELPAPEVAAISEAAPVPETPPQTALLAPALRPAVPTAPPRAAAPPPLATLAGEWDAEQKGIETTPAMLRFVVTNGAITGTMRLNGEELTLYDVREQGSKVSFSLVIPGSPYVTVRYEGTLAGDTLMLAGMGDNMGDFMLSATRNGAAPAPGPVIASLTPPAAPEQQLGLSEPVPLPREKPLPEVPPPAAVEPPPQVASLTPPAAQPPQPAPAVTLPDNLVLPQAPLILPTQPPPQAAPPPPPPVAQPTPVPLQASIAERAAAQADDLIGDWHAKVTAPSGLTQDFTLTFRRDGGALSGVRKTATGEADLSDLIRNSNTISFSLPDPSGATRAYEGTIASDVISLSSGSFFTGQWSLTAQREAPSKPTPSVQPEANGPVAEKLPLPPLRNVPANGLAQKPLMGWASRQRLGTDVDDDAIRQAADALDEVGLKQFGYSTIELDDGWQGTRDADGTLRANEKFPDMRALADYVHSKGLKLGLATSAGPKSCAGLEGSYGHEAADAKIFADWNVDYIVVDWCNLDGVYTTQAERQAAFQKMGEALAASGRDIVFGLNPGGKFDAGPWGARTGANLWRTGGNIEDNWKSVVAAANAQAGRETVAGPGHWNDPGLIQTGNGGMNTDEYRSQMNLWALFAAPFMLGNDVRIMMRETVTLLTNAELIAVNQDPLGRQARLAAINGDTEVWVKPLADGSLAVGLFNFGNTSARAGATAAQLGLDGPRQVRDLWWHAPIGVANGGYDAFLTPHTSLLLKLSR